MTLFKKSLLIISFLSFTLINSQLPSNNSIALDDSTSSLFFNINSNKRQLVVFTEDRLNITKLNDTTLVMNFTTVENATTLHSSLTKIRFSKDNQTSRITFNDKSIYVQKVNETKPLSDFHGKRQSNGYLLGLNSESYPILNFKYFVNSSDSPVLKKSSDALGYLTDATGKPVYVSTEDWYLRANANNSLANTTSITVPNAAVYFSGNDISLGGAGTNINVLNIKTELLSFTKITPDSTTPVLTYNLLPLYTSKDDQADNKPISHGKIVGNYKLYLIDSDGLVITSDLTAPKSTIKPFTKEFETVFKYGSNGFGLVFKYAICFILLLVFI
jgi:hypothetical protein